MFDLYFKCHKSTTLYLKKQLLLPKKDFPCIFIYPIAQKGNFHILRFRHPSYHHTDILRALIRFGQ